MSIYFKIKTEKEVNGENGQENVMEVVVLQAVNYTDAEAIATDIYEGLTHDVKKIEKVKFSEIIGVDIETEDPWILTNVTFKTVNDNGKEKKTTEPFLIKAEDVKSACNIVDEMYKETTFDYFIKGTSVTNIIDVYLEEKESTEAAE